MMRELGCPSHSEPRRCPMAGDWTIRRAVLEDDDEIAGLFDAVAGEGRWIGRELPIDHAARRARFAAGLAETEATANFFAVAVWRGRAGDDDRRGMAGPRGRLGPARRGHRMGPVRGCAQDCPADVAAQR